MPLPLMYLCARPQREAAGAEYESFRSALDVTPQMLVAHDLVREPLPAGAEEQYAGFVVGGSPFNLADPEDTKTDAQRRLESDLERVAAAAAESRTAGFFTCYGIGVVTRMLGGEVSRAYPEDTGPTRVELSADGESDPLFGRLGSRFTALTAHKEGTGSVPPAAVLLATNPACPVQAYRVGERLYATQFHPEPTAEAFIQRMTVYRNDGYFEAKDFDEIAARVRAASVTEPVRALSAFAERFAA